jgi:LPPG:FO 2-phospho-L-lactate transferase
MRAMQMEVSAVGVARGYQDFLDVLVLDQVDEALCEPIERLGVRPVVTDTIMRGPAEKAALARVALEAADQKRRTQ